MGLPAKGDEVYRSDAGKKIAVVQFADGTEAVTAVRTDAEAKAIAMAASKKHGSKVLGGYCATRDD